MVEDSDAYRTMIYEFLTRIKNSVSSDGIEFSVKGFSSGEEFLENLNNKPDVVILDYFLDSAGYTKNADGLSIIKKIKQTSSDTDVVVLSAQNEIDVMKEFWKSGADEYVHKSNAAPLKIYDFISNSIKRREKSTRFFKKMQYLAIAALVLFAILSIYFFISN